MNPKPRPKVLLAVTCPISWTFYRGLPRHLSGAGFDPVLLSSPGENLHAMSEQERVPAFAVAMERGIAPFEDLISVWKLCRLFRTIRPDIVDASTPKAGLLVGLAARLVRIPRLVYTLRGLRLETETGVERRLLWVTERISCACAGLVICVSPSLRERAIALKLVSRDKTVVLRKGSSGVDLDRFAPPKASRREAKSFAHRLGIPDAAPVLGFVGRLVKDKGIQQLLAAFQMCREKFPALQLLLVGDFETANPIAPELQERIASTAGIIHLGFVNDPAPYYHLMDVLAFPTHREGFGQVSLEAQASGIPVVTTDATGAKDSVIDGVTGFVIPVGDASALARAIAKLLNDPLLRARMGKEGRAWAEQDFGQETIWDAQADVYRQLLAQENAAGKPLRRMVKRGFDLSLSAFALVLLSPVLLITAILVRSCLGRPVLFRQQRPGLHGKCFTLFKFRTMRNSFGPDGALLPDLERLTSFGRFLRSTSLDELPELFNVIRGEMSLVGPRPLLPQYLGRYTREQAGRHLVKPGITGWAQINGRNSLDWAEKFALDLWYVANHSFRLDVCILARTIWQVLRRDGIAQPGHATMPEFLGIQAESGKESI
jgi:lipopolysaccharide/colanic/teichoic acid biosynthesis glycosyltransferase/glycosyltransferase involved in cell wall biosynthesis